MCFLYFRRLFNLLGRGRGRGKRRGVEEEEEVEGRKSRR